MNRTRRALVAIALGAALVAPMLGTDARAGLELPDDAVAPNGLDRCAPDGSDHTVRTLTQGATAAELDGLEPILRFVQLSDTHIIDDDGPDVANGTVTEVVLDPAIGNTSATFLNEEYTDEVLNAMISTINACNDAEPLSLAITTGDITDTNWLNVTRRVIDNVAGEVHPTTAFEQLCGYQTHDSNGQPKLGAPAECPIPAELLEIPTGRLVDDAQMPDGPAGGPDVENDPTYQFDTTRTLRMALESAATAAANGSATIAPGLPADMDNEALDVPYYAVFGNHDVTVKGTVSYQAPFGPPLTAFGRYFFESKREFINEWFVTNGVNPGAGFQHAGARLSDADDRNDGYYAFSQPAADGGSVRFVILDTTYDGVDQRIHRDGDTGGDTGGHVHGNEATDPRGLEAGYMSFEQRDWLAAELAAAAAAGEPVMVYSHHPDRNFAERSYPADVQTTAVDLDELLGKASHGGNPSTVVAHIAGHTHANRVKPCRPGDCPIGGGAPDEASIERGFWRVETASLIDWPQESRIVEVFELPSGEFALRLTMISPDQSDSAAARSRALSGFEEMCSVHDMMGGPMSSGPYDQSRLEELFGNVSSADFCPNREGVLVGADHPAGSLADRDVLLLP